MFNANLAHFEVISDSPDDVLARQFPVAVSTGFKAAIN